MKNQSTIKVRSRTKELLDEMSERFGLPVAQIVDIMAKMAKKA